MRVGTRVAAVMAVAMLVATGCSWRQTQAWFAVRGVTVDEVVARDIADKVNANEPAGCDQYYVGACVPSNATEVSCLGGAGGGVKLRGPFSVDRWDHHGLDPDRNGIACDANAPVGSLDDVSVHALAISVSGWAVDLDTTRPVQVGVSVDGVLTRTVAASEPRPDVAAATGFGTNVGFAVGIPVATGAHQVCAVAYDTTTLIGMGPKVPDTTLGCRTVQVGQFEPLLISYINDLRARYDRGPVLVCPALTSAAQQVAAQRLAGTAPATWTLIAEDYRGASGATATDLAGSNGFGGPAKMLHHVFAFDANFSIYVPYQQLYLESTIALPVEDKAIGIAAVSTWKPLADVAFAVVWGEESDCA